MRPVKAARENSFIVEISRQPTADELLESLRAETLLAKMEWFEEIAGWHDAETCPHTRWQFSESYRRAIGVHPDQRHELHAALERVQEGGGMPVSDVVAVLQRNMELKERHVVSAVSE